VPRSTVYFIARVKDDVKARAYCRNLKTRQGAPFGRIRLEAQARYGPLDVMLDDVQDPSFCASVWHSRYEGWREPLRGSHGSYRQRSLLGGWVVAR
jgi:hypothetical protein